MDLKGFLDKQPKRKNGHEIWTWNVRIIYRARSLRTVAEEVSKYKLDIVGVQEVIWYRGGTEVAGENTMFCGKGKENHD
jgi:hypothetical protein